MLKIIRIGVRAKYTLFLSDFNATWILSKDSWKILTQVSNLIKIIPVGAESFYADCETDRQTDRHDETNSRFSQLYKRT
jgi:hypothetical protein